MDEPATPVYRFGDLLALARQSWASGMARELEARAFPGYRLSDAASMRFLLAAPRSVGELGELLGVTRQAARKVVSNLEARGHVTTAVDPEDGRKLNVRLTPAGRGYARAIVEVIATLNRALAARVSPEQLRGADAVLRAVLEGQGFEARGRAIPSPPRPDRSQKSAKRPAASGSRSSLRRQPR